MSNTIDLTIRVNDRASAALSSVSGLFSQTQKLANSLAAATKNLDGRFAAATNTAARFASRTSAVVQTTTDAYRVVKKLKSDVFALTVAKKAQAAAANVVAASTTAQTAAMSKQKVVQLKVNKALALSASGSLTALKAMKKLSVQTMLATVKTGLQTKAMKKTTAAKWLLAAGAKGAVAAVKALGAAIKVALGPIGLIIAGVGLLTAGVAALINRLNGCSAAAQENATRLREVNEAAEQSVQAYEYARIAIDKQANSANSLADELDVLRRNQSRTREEQERMEEIVSELSTAYGGLNLSIDEYGNLIGKSTDELRKYIRERRDIASFNNAIELRNTLEAQHIDILEGQRRAQEEVDRLMGKSGRANRRRLERAKETLDGFNDALAENNAAFQANADTLNRAFTSTGKSIEVLAEQWGKTVTEVEQAMDRYGFNLDDMVAHQEAVMARQKEDLENLADHWGMNVDDIIAEMDKYGISMDEWAANQQRAWEDTQASIREHTGNIINNFRDLPSSLDQSFEEMARMLANNRQIYNQWSKNIQEISGDVSEGVLRELKSLGTAGSELLAAALDSNNEGYEAAWEVIRELEAGIQDATAHATDTIVPVGEEVGKVYAESVIVGAEGADYTRLVDVIENAAESTIAVAQAGGESTGDAYVRGVTTALEAVDFTPVVTGMDNATSKMARNTDRAMSIIKSVTTDAMTYVKNSIYSNMTQAETKATNGLMRIKAMFNGLRISLPVSLFAAGNRAMEGMRLGMLSKEPAILGTARRIAENVTRIIKRALQISSPSRAMMKLGDSTMKGFAIGMERMQDRVKRVVDDTAYMVKDGLDKALAESKLSGDLTVVAAGANATVASNLLQSIRDEIKAGFEAGQMIVLDSGELVGATYGQIDSVSGAAISYSNRWGR